MIDTEAEYRDDADGFRTPRKPRNWSGVTAIVGTIAVYASMLAARGNGWSPLVFLLLGLFGTPLLAAILQRWKPQRPWTMRLVAVLALSVLSFGLAKYSTRINADDAFREIFPAGPPPGLTCIKARQQWFDGRDVVVAFSAPASAIPALLQGHSFKDESFRTPDLMKFGIEVGPLEMSDLYPPSMTKCQRWSYLEQDPSGDFTVIEILWDEPTGIGIVRCGWH